MQTAIRSKMENLAENLSQLKLTEKVTGIAYNEAMLKHECLWTEHIENPNRLRKIVDVLRNSGVWGQCAIEEESFEAASSAVGCGIDLVTKVCKNELRNGFALLRPASHHAGVSEASGYCIFNNIAVAAKHALEHLGAKKILIVDWDVHHGQGTQDIFYEDDRVLYFSVHRYECGKFWPHLRRGNFDFCGSEKGYGYNVNVPLNKFDPDLVLVSAGFDAVQGDPKGEMMVSPEMFGHLTHLLNVLANGKLILFLEGGYDLDMIARCVEVCVNVLLGKNVPALEKNLDYSVDETTVHSILNVTCTLGHIWSLLRYPTTASGVDVRNWPRYKRVIKFTPREQAEEEPRTSGEKRQSVPFRSSKSSRQEFSTGTCLGYNERMEKHRCSAPHPECPERLERIYKKLTEEGLVQKLVGIPHRTATKEEIGLIHKENYVNLMEGTAKSSRLRKLLENQFNSVFLSAESYTAALLAVGISLKAVDEVEEKKCGNGLALPRPPGHHALEDEAYGFCIFNNVAIAAKYAQKVYGVRKILIFDWDIHHGNGTQDAFYDDPNVLYISLHRFEHGFFFPVEANSDFVHVGKRLGKGFNVNVPWSGFSMGEAEYLAALFYVVLPICYEFDPDLVLVSAGFDAAKGDPIGGYQLTPGFFGVLTHFLCGLAEGKVILVLEGGYNLKAISNCVATCAKVLLGEASPRIALNTEDWPCHDTAWTTVRDVAHIQDLFWKSLRGFQVTFEYYGAPIPDKKSTGLSKEVGENAKSEDEGG